MLLLAHLSASSPKECHLSSEFHMHFRRSVPDAFLPPFHSIPSTLPLMRVLTPQCVRSLSLKWDDCSQCTRTAFFSTYGLQRYLHTALLSHSESWFFFMADLLSLATAGSSGFYEGSALSLTSHRVIVTLNYRLGALGFFASMNCESEDPRAVGTYGMMDQRLALQWVRDNIASFGGDPIASQYLARAQEHSACAITSVSPASASLFHAAIMQSGSCDALIFYTPSSISKNYSRTFAASLGCTGTDVLSCMRSADLRKMQHHWPNGTGRDSVPPLAPLFPWGPTIRDHTSSSFPIFMRLIRRGAFNRVPIIAGTNKDEGTLFASCFALCRGWQNVAANMCSYMMR